MSELKTQPTKNSVEEYLNSIEDEKKRQDSFIILEMMKKATGEEPVMWGDSIIGLGRYHYKYASGREGDSLITGFSPRKANLTLYITSGFELYEKVMKDLGKYKTGKACLYIKKLEDIDQSVLQRLIEESVEHMRKTNP